jgi:hypothetical protein
VDVEPGVPQRKDLLQVLERLGEVQLVARRLVSQLLLPVAEPQVLMQQVEVQLALVLRFPPLLKPVSVPRVWQPVGWASQVWLPEMCRRLRLASEPQAAARLVLPEQNRRELEAAALAPAWARRDRQQFRLRLPPGQTAQVFSQVPHQLR